MIPDGQGGLLAGWTYFGCTADEGCAVAGGAAANNRVLVEHVTGSGQSEYSLALATAPDWNYPGPLAVPNGSVVVGENGVAFETDGQSVVSFNVADGSVNWTSAGNSIVAATEGNGLVLDIPTYNGTTWSQQIVQLDGTGTPVSTWEYNSDSLQYDAGDQWLALGSTDAVSGLAILRPNVADICPSDIQGYVLASHVRRIDQGIISIAII